MSHELLKIIIFNDNTWEAAVGICQYINFIFNFQAVEISVVSQMYGDYLNLWPGRL